MRKFILIISFLSLFFISPSCKKEAKDSFDISIQIMSNPVIGGQDFTFRVYSSHPFYIDDLRAGYEIPNWKGVLQTPRDGYVTFTCKNPEVEETTRETLWMKVISYTTGEYKRISTDYVAYKDFSFEYVNYPAYVIDGSDFSVTVRCTEPKAKVCSYSCEFVMDDLRTDKVYEFTPGSGDGFYYRTFTASGVAVDGYRTGCTFSLGLGSAEGGSSQTKEFTYAKNTKFTAKVTLPDAFVTEDAARAEIPVEIESSRKEVFLSDYSCTIAGLKGIAFTNGGVIMRKGDKMDLTKATKAILTGEFDGRQDGKLALRVLDGQDPRQDAEKVGENFKIDFRLEVKGTGPDPVGDGEVIIKYKGETTIPEPITMDIYDKDDYDSTSEAEIAFSPSKGGIADSGYVISQINAGSGAGSVDLYVGGQKKAMPYTFSNPGGGTVVLRGVKAGEVTLRIESKSNSAVHRDVTFFVRHRLALVLSGTFTKEGLTTFDNWVGWDGLPESMKLYLCEYPSTLGIGELAKSAEVHPGSLSGIAMAQYIDETVGLSADLSIVHKSYYTIDRERFYLCGNNPDAVYEGVSGHQYRYLHDLYEISRFNSPMKMGTTVLNQANSYSWSGNDKEWSLIWTLRMLDDNMKYIYKHIVTECITHAPEWEYFYIDVSNVKYDSARNNVKYVIHLYKTPMSGEKPYWYSNDNKACVQAVR